MTTRRKFLKILGGGTILAAAGATTFALTRTPTKALAPWGATTTYTEPRRRALAHALLAPNPHNLQPWLIELKSDDTVILHRDESRTLPMTDPFSRQIFIGLGCFIEQMIIAASADGYSVDLSILPDGEDGPIAQATFSNGATPDPLANHILNRHCDKGLYTGEPIAPDAVKALVPYANVVTAPTETKAIRELIWEALEIELFTPRTLKESIDVMRIGKREINANPDGLELQGAIFDLGRMSGYITEELLMDTNHPTFQGVIQENIDNFASTPAFVHLNTDTNTRLDQIETGRKWLRMHLKITELGLGLQPVSQCLQEYPEMAEHYKTIHQMLASEGQTVQMLGRLGYGNSAIKTPRWPLEAKMLNET
jgi:hypothetical protein